MKVIIGDTTFMSPAGDGWPFYMVIRAAWSYLQGKGSTFISQSCKDSECWSGPRNQTCDLPLCSQVLLLTELILLWCSNTIIHFISEGSAMWIWWNGSKRWVTVYGAIFMITERLSLWNESILVLLTRYWTTFQSCVQVIALCTNDVTISGPCTNIEPTWSV